MSKPIIWEISDFKIIFAAIFTQHAKQSWGRLHANVIDYNYMELSGRVLDSRPRGRGLEPFRGH